MQTNRKFILGYANLANGITIFGLILSLLSCYFVLSGNLKASMMLLIASGICDLFDGVVARKIKRTDEEKTFGVQLDAVVDVVSFGITPAIIVYSFAGAAWYTLLALTFYIICAVVRLAYFNATAVPNKPTAFYKGLPVTYIALILPIALLFRVETASIITLAVVGVLFVLNIKIPKPRGVWYIVFPIMAAALIALWWFI